MPELPEVERARKLIASTCTGLKIAEVDARPDHIVFAGGTTHEDFAQELKGRTIQGCSRKGKNFWLDLSGPGRVPAMHLGMTGMVMIKGIEPDWYVRRPKKAEMAAEQEWPPPKYVKFILKLVSEDPASTVDPVQLAFLDSRRLARIRLLPQPPLDHPPLSLLGFDPYLSHPSLPEFLALLNARPRSTIKGLIMDQAFSAGVGNWVADEILYQARVHPACPVGMLTEEQKEAVWREMRNVVVTAVEVNADHRKFPKDWLFSWRWGKGKKNKRKSLEGTGGGMRLPNGQPATLDFVTVGGRTSAYVVEVQTLPEGVAYKAPRKRKSNEVNSDIDSSTDESALTALSEDEKVKTELKASTAPAAKVVRPSERASEPLSLSNKRKLTTLAKPLSSSNFSVPGEIKSFTFRPFARSYTTLSPLERHGLSNLPRSYNLSIRRLSIARCMPPSVRPPNSSLISCLLNALKRL